MDAARRTAQGVGRAVLAAGLIVAMLSGCTVQREWLRQGPESAPASGPHDHSLPHLPEVPAELADDGPTGAHAAARHFFALYDYGLQTGDLDDLDAMSAPGCEFCQWFLSDIGGLYASGGYVLNGHTNALPGVVYAQPADPAHYTVRTHVTLSVFAIVLGTGSPPALFLGSEAIMTVQVARDDRGWQVSQVDLMALPGPFQGEPLCAGVTGCVAP